MRVTTPEIFLCGAMVVTMMYLTVAFSFVMRDECVVESMRVDHHARPTDGIGFNNLTLFVRSASHPDLTADIMVFSAPALQEALMLRATERFPVGRAMLCGVYSMRFTKRIDFVLGDQEYHRALHANNGVMPLEIIMGRIVVAVWFVLQVLLRVWICTRVEYANKDD